jgi:hypothetical protein
MNRRSGLGLSMLRMRLWTGQTVFGESGLALSLVVAVRAVSSPCFGGNSQESLSPKLSLTNKLALW